MKTCIMNVLLLVVFLCLALTENIEDSMCLQKACPSDKECKVVTWNIEPGVYSLRPLCLDMPKLGE